jgi:hypothetical protein
MTIIKAGGLHRRWAPRINNRRGLSVCSKGVISTRRWVATTAGEDINNQHACMHPPKNHKRRHAYKHSAPASAISARYARSVSSAPLFVDSAENSQCIVPWSYPVIPKGLVLAAMDVALKQIWREHIMLNLTAGRRYRDGGSGVSGQWGRLHRTDSSRGCARPRNRSTAPARVRARPRVCTRARSRLTAHTEVARSFTTRRTAKTVTHQLLKCPFPRL